MILLSRKILLILFCFILILSACNENDRLDIERSASAFDIKQGEASVKQSNKNFMKAFETNDSAAVANCYTTDAKAMLANRTSIEGKDSIRHFYAGAMKNGVRNFDLKTIKIWGDSSILAEEGLYKYSDSNGKQLDKGKYIVLWKLESGNWKMYRDIWTSDLPPAAMVPEKKSSSKK
ncbi:MAG TPA: DUF4440 domain-containing protein [Hanamia sp.]|jgi:ketosteroid isomerase-like protein|nr:DUF4440 domain-containing protein [Hanamia sp.]